MKNIISILSVLACILILVVGVLIKPTIVNTEYTIKVDKVNSGSDKEILSQEFEKYKDDLKQNYKENIEQLNNKYNLLLTLVGIAVTVWVGLNIYNLVDRVQIDLLAKKQKDINESINTISDRINKFNEEIGTISSAIEGLNKEKQDLQKLVDKINKSIKELNTQTAAIQKRNNDFDSAIRNVSRGL